MHYIEKMKLVIKLDKKLWNQSLCKHNLVQVLVYTQVLEGLQN